MLPSLHPRHAKLCKSLCNWLATTSQTTAALPPEVVARCAAEIGLEMGPDERHLVALLQQWLTLRAVAKPQAPWPSLVDLVRSDLFARLRAGLPVLPYPPPRSQGELWYDVVLQQGPHRADEGTVDADRTRVDPKDGVVLRRQWYQVLETLGDQRFLIAPDDSRSPHRFVLWRAANPEWRPHWRTFRIEERRLLRDGKLTPPMRCQIEVTPPRHVWWVQNAAFVRTD